MTEKTITICGKDVPILYCAATETGYERLSQKGIDVFLPTFGTNPEDPEKTIMTAPPTANTEDYLQLAIAAIVAANEAERQAKKLKQEELPLPIDADDLLYRATKAEVTALITAVVELRNEWYGLSKVISDSAMKPAEVEDPDDKKEQAEKN